MKISIIIPTHNRADQLTVAIDSVVALRNEADFDLVVVDNNSTDSTKEVVKSYGSLATYMFEGSTAFTRARNTGAEKAIGDILLYLDDDVIVNPGSLKRIIDVFENYSDCGVIAGQVLPKFTKPPPKWALECQANYNGWSLLSKGTYPWLQHNFQEAPTAVGPMMAIRRDVYEMIGGFPPDTVGVETNRGDRSFSKLYIGPGDGGLCVRVREAGLKIYYSSDISVYHVIPPLRFTLSFWRSRMIGEGYYHAISQRGFYQLNRSKLFLERMKARVLFHKFEKDLLVRLGDLSSNGDASPSFEGMFPEEMWVRYYKAYLDMDWVLQQYPTLWEFLWKIGYEGVSSDNFDDVMGRLPSEYKELVSKEFVYDSTPLDSVATYNNAITQKGYYHQSSKIAMKAVFLALRSARPLYRLLRKASL